MGRRAPAAPRVRRALAALGLVLVLALVGAPPAGAHAELLTTTPGDGQTVDEPPSSVTLEFTEPVSVSLGGVRVFDSRGEPRGPRQQPARAPTPATWWWTSRTASPTAPTSSPGGSSRPTAIPIHGGFVFSIGSPSQLRDGLLDSLLDQQGEQSWQAVGRRAARHRLRRAAAGRRGLDRPGLVRTRARPDAPAAVSSPPPPAIGTAAVLAALPVQAILSTGLGIGAITEPGVLDQVLGAGVGLSVLLAVIGAALLVMAARVPVNPTTRVVTGLGALLAAGSFAAAGHTRSTDPAWLATAADTAHVWAAAVWFGGVVVLALALRRRRDDPDPVDAATLVSRFSSVAGIALLVVAAAGGVLAWGEVRAVRALTSTTYGWLLVVKTAIVALVAAGRRVQPLPARPPGRGRPGGRRRLDGTCAARSPSRRSRLLAVLGVTGVLVGVTPARTEAGIGSVTSITTELGTGTVNLTIDPNRAGPNTIHIYLLDELGRQADTADEVELRFSQPSRDIGPITRTPTKAGPGHWQYDGDVLSIPGPLAHRHRRQGLGLRRGSGRRRPHREPLGAPRTMTAFLHRPATRRLAAALGLAAGVVLTRRPGRGPHPHRPRAGTRRQHHHRRLRGGARLRGLADRGGLHRDPAGRERRERASRSPGGRPRSRAGWPAGRAVRSPTTVPGVFPLRMTLPGQPGPLPFKMIQRCADGVARLDRGHRRRPARTRAPCADPRGHRRRPRPAPPTRPSPPPRSHHPTESRRRPPRRRRPARPLPVGDAADTTTTTAARCRTCSAASPRSS